MHSFKFPMFEISTSYRQFAEAVGARLGFDAAHIFCTELDLDRPSRPRRKPKSCGAWKRKFWRPRPSNCRPGPRR